MKLPIKDKKFIFLLVAITIVIALEVLSIIALTYPCLLHRLYSQGLFWQRLQGYGSGIQALFKLTIQ